MKTIGIVVDNEFNADIRVRKEIEILKNQYKAIHVLCFAFNDKQYPEVEGVYIHRVRMSRKKKDILYFLFNRFPAYESMWRKKIKAFIDENMIDVLHVHDLYMAMSARKAISQTKEIPLIVDLHENFPCAIQLYNWTKGWLREKIIQPKKWITKEKDYLGAATKLIVLSDYFKQTLLQRYTFLKAENIVSFPNIIDFRRFETFSIDTNLMRSDKVTLMYFGGVAQRRGIFETIAVFKRALKQTKNIKLLIIGPVDKADKARFFEAIQTPELESYIEYIPWIKVDELVSYMNISDIFLSPLIKNDQHESGVANKIYQYMYGAKPIIASNCIPQQTLIEQFNCGLIFSSEDEYLAHILTLVKDNELRKRLGENGRQKLYETFDNDNFEAILLNLYKSL